MLRRAALPLCALLFCSVQAHAQPGREIRKAARPAAGRYLVVLNPSEDGDAVGSEVAALHRGRLRHVYRSALAGFAIDLPEPAARALAADPRVRYVEEDAIVTAFETQTEAPWGLDRIDQRTLPLDQLYSYRLATLPVSVHVVDTGVRTTHVDFGGRAAIAADYIDDDGDGDPYDVSNDDGISGPDGGDCHGHGTHVAGTIGGELHGVAKTVTLWSHRVLDCSGNGLLSGIVAAVDAITGSPVRPAVANLSLGGGPSAALDEAVRGSIASGVVYVVAAGNDNVDASRTSPARVAEAITVGATRADDTRSNFSNFGPSLDLFAPGSNIRSAAFSSDIATTAMSGTSMAAPHAAGVAALYLQMDPAASPAAVRNALVSGSVAGVVVGAGFGSPNVLLQAPPAPVAGVISVMYPTASANLGIGSAHLLKWKHNLGKGSLVKVDISRDAGLTWTEIAGSVTNASETGVYKWIVTGPATTEARLRITALSNPAATTVGPITIAEPFITVTRPVLASHLWTVGTAQTVQWNSNLGRESVRIELSQDGGSTYGVVLFSATPSDGKQKVTVQPAWLTDAARVRIVWVRNPSIADESTSTFAIR